MIKIETLEVIPIKPDSVYIKWKFSPHVDDLADYTLSLERSLSPEVDFVTIFRFKDEVQFLDSFNYRRLWRETYYRIKIEKDGVTHYSPLAKFGYAPNLEALEIVRRYDILLKNRRHGIGIPMAVFIRKRDGIKCDCWDAIKQRTRSSNCELCFQTGYLGGFHDPIVAWINPSPDNKTTPISQFGEGEPNDTKVLMSNYPEVQPKDVIVNPTEMRIWIVDNVNISARRGFTLRQLIDMTYLDRSNVMYKLLDKYPDLVDTILTEKKKIQRS